MDDKLIGYSVMLASGARTDGCGCFVPQKVIEQGEQAVKEYIVKQALDDEVYIFLNEEEQADG